VRSRLGTTIGEAAYARRLLVEVKDRDTALSGPAEVSFAVNLVRSFSADSTDGRYLPEYPALAAALRELREDRELAIPRLMLQEAHLLREWSMRQPEEQWAAKVRALAEASNILIAALGSEPPASLRSSLNVELASTFGAHAQALSAAPDAVGERVRLFSQAREAVLRARAEDEETYHPVDVLAWTTIDLIRDGVLDEAERAEAITEVLSAFELIDPLELDSSQVERYYRRRQQFAELVGDTGLADEAFDALAAQGSGAGVYLRARGIADPSSLAQPLSATDMENIQTALEYLAEYGDLIASDVRCLNLQFDLWWILYARQRPFADERYCVPFDAAAWHEAQRMVEGLQGTRRTYREVPLLFLRGLAEFHLGDYAAAFGTFSEVTQRSDEVSGRRRIVRSYLASASGARPAIYSGTVSWMSEDLRRGAIYVDELRRLVAFIPREFGGRELSRGANLGDFHIGFNFLGVIADPPGYLRVRREAR